MCYKVMKKRRVNYKWGNFCNGTTWIKPEYFEKTTKNTNERSEHPLYQQQKTSNIPKK